MHYLDKLYSSIKETDPIFLPGNILLGECLVVVKIAGKKDEIKIVWPLFKIDDDDWYDFNSEESLAAYISYRDYLLERVKNE